MTASLQLNHTSRLISVPAKPLTGGLLHDLVLWERGISRDRDPHRQRELHEVGLRARRVKSKNVTAERIRGERIVFLFSPYHPTIGWLTTTRIA